jgi:hypothetical protein
MKAMFDDFASFPLPEWDIDIEDDKPISCFVDQKDFDGLDLVETNVIPERQVNHAIEVNSAIGEE